MEHVIPYTTCGPSQAKRSTEETFVIFVLKSKEAIYEEAMLVLTEKLQSYILRDSSAYWIEEARSTEITKDQVQQMLSL